tara:strand:+ start:485 stop:1420 length:936 start_codon:yes stop_codon:yes gene_type:complete
MNWIKKGLIYKPKEKFFSSHSQLPISIKLKDRVRLFFSGRDKFNRSRPYFIDLDINNLKKIISKTKGPILELGEAGTFDDCGVMPTHIMKYKKNYYMYYIGWNNRKNIPYSNSVGLALSKDCKNFKKISKAPILDRNIFDPFYTGTFTVKKIKNKFEAIYLSCIGWKKIKKRMEPIYDFKFASSKDAINWNRKGKVAISLKKNEGGLSAATIVKFKNIFHMWYSYRGISEFRRKNKNSYRIGYAYSKNFKNWKRNDKKFNLDLSKSSKDWDFQMMAYPNVIKIKKKLVMFYNGNGFGKSGIGYAEMNLIEI